MKPPTADDRLAYSVTTLAQAMSLSPSSIRKEIAENRLVPSRYYGTKALFDFEHAIEWRNSLPTDPPRNN